jgi:hypothetical protein
VLTGEIWYLFCELALGPRVIWLSHPRKKFNQNVSPSSIYCVSKILLCV